jgi:REP element-mobilizing transposase RayT
MKYDPNIHHRQSIRLKGYDYSQAGAYFLTLCTYQRQCLFGEIVGGAMQLNPYGQVVADCWQAIPDHFPRIALDVSVVMPNHIHGILSITDEGRGNDEGRGKALPCPYEGRFGKPIPGSLPVVIGSFKSAVTKHINRLRGVAGTPVWQRNYYEHVIGDGQSLDALRQYLTPTRFLSLPF